MERRLTTRDFMATELVVLRPDMPLHAAMQVLLEHDVSGAPVVDTQGALVGILTEKDCFAAAVRASYHDEPWGPVATYMSTEVETLDADTPIIEVVERFYASNYRRFPVLEGARLIGQISRRDALRAVATLW